MKSECDGQLYIGWTIDIAKRVIEHNEGRVTSTKYRRPLKLLYYEACLTKEGAVEREKQLKTGFGRAYLKRRIGS